VNKAADIGKTDKETAVPYSFASWRRRAKATLILDGFNDLVALKIGNDRSGPSASQYPRKRKIYFLSDSSGKISVVKTNLDGGNHAKPYWPVLAREDDHGTVLLASVVGYLALLSKRAGSSSTFI